MDTLDIIFMSLGSIFFDPFVWTTIILWVIYRKDKNIKLKRIAIILTSIAAVIHLVIMPLLGYFTEIFNK